MKEAIESKQSSRNISMRDEDLHSEEIVDSPIEENEFFL